MNICPDCLDETETYCPDCDYCEECAAPICDHCGSCYDCCRCPPQEEDDEWTLGV